MRIVTKPWAKQRKQEEREASARDAAKRRQTLRHRHTAGVAEAFPAFDDTAAGQSGASGLLSGQHLLAAAMSEGPARMNCRAFLFRGATMTIARARQSDREHCRRRNTWALARWRGKHRERYNAYQRAYQRKYRARKREAVR